MVLYLETDVQRRAYTRVDDLLPLAWRLVTADEHAQVRAFFDKHRYLPPKPGDDVRRLLTQLTNSKEVAALREKQPSLIFILEHMDAKINLILRLLHPTLVEHTLLPTRVNLGGDGILIWMQADPPVAVGDCLEVHLTLAVNALVAVGFFGQVLRIGEENEDGLRPVACCFDPILDEHREQIIQHVFKRQTDLLRAQRGR
ncbi:MAG: hypothetical protein H7837_00930 [Magnetococcus sp. MYC-9]